MKASKNFWTRTWEKYGIAVMCIAILTYSEFQFYQKQSDQLSSQVDLLQEKVAILQAQVTELNDNVKWLMENYRK